MSFQRRFLLVLLGTASAVVSQAAHAEPSAKDIASAKAAFQFAVSLENRQRWAEAEVRLRQALAVKETPGLHYHLARCEAEQGHLLEAAAAYGRASELIREGAKAPDVAALLGSASEALDRRIPRVVVDLPADLRGPLVRIDGKAYPPSEAELGVPLNPGSHEVRVSASEQRSFARVISLRERENVSVAAELTPLSPPLAELPAPHAAPSAPRATRSMTDARNARPSSAKLALMIGESAFTVAGLAVGFAYRAVASSAADRISVAQIRIDSAGASDSAACSSESRSSNAAACADLRSAIDDRNRAILVSNVGLISAGVGAAAFIATWLAVPGPRNHTGRVLVQPVLGPGSIGVRGRF